jgi:hypothetical protein
MLEMRKVYRILARKHEEKRPLDRLRCRHRDNIINSDEFSGLAGSVIPGL